MDMNQLYLASSVHREREGNLVREHELDRQARERAAATGPVAVSGTDPVHAGLSWLRSRALLRPGVHHAGH